MKKVLFGAAAVAQDRRIVTADDLLSFIRASTSRIVSGFSDSPLGSPDSRESSSRTFRRRPTFLRHSTSRYMRLYSGPRFLQASMLS